MSGKSHIGRYVCYGEEDGSFSWGRIKDEGLVNSPEGDKEVFILTDRMTCRVGRGEEEQKSIQAMSRKISAGTAGPIKLPGQTNPDTLPNYQQFGGRTLAASTEAPEEKTTTVPAVVNTPEGQGVVPKLEDIMTVPTSRGLAILQQAGSVKSSLTGKKIDFLLRKFGYDTNVRKERLDLERDIVDVSAFGMDNFTDDELFLLAMQAKVDEVSGGRLNQGMRNIIMLNAGGSEDEIVGLAVKELKERRSIL